MPTPASTDRHPQRRRARAALPRRDADGRRRSTTAQTPRTISKYGSAAACADAAVVDERVAGDAGGDARAPAPAPPRAGVPRRRAAPPRTSSTPAPTASTPAGLPALRSAPRAARPRRRARSPARAAGDGIDGRQARAGVGRRQQREVAPARARPTPPRTARRRASTSHVRRRERRQREHARDQRDRGRRVRVAGVRDQRVPARVQDGGAEDQRERERAQRSTRAGTASARASPAGVVPAGALLVQPALAERRRVPELAELGRVAAEQQPDGPVESSAAAAAWCPASSPGGTCGPGTTPGSRAT